MRRDGAENRERILHAAEAVFGTAGAAASTEEVARRAGVGVATVFRHFPTKQDLVEATAVRYLQELEAEARQRTGGADAGHALEDLVLTLVSRQATKVTFMGLLHTDGPGVTEAVLAASRSYHDAARIVLGRAQASGQARPDTTVEEVFSLVRALAHVSHEEHADRVVRIALDGLAARR